LIALSVPATLLAPLFPHPLVGLQINQYISEGKNKQEGHTMNNTRSSPKTKTTASIARYSELIAFFISDTLLQHFSRIHL